MKLRLLVLSLVVVILALAWRPGSLMAQTKERRRDPCSDTSNMTQGEMNACAVQDLERTEAKLRRVLKEAGIAGDSAEEKAWEAYRDSVLSAFYPLEDAGSFGSIYPLCVALTRKALTDGRIRDVQRLTYTREGETCVGYRLGAALGNSRTDRFQCSRAARVNSKQG